MTESEDLFRRFCESRGWQIDRIDARSMPLGSKMPDFCLQMVGGTRIIVEVKQLEPNQEEQEWQRRSDAGETVVYGNTPGKRIRKKISQANTQLKAFEGAHPGMLVVFNRTGFDMHDHSYDVLTAMRGLDVLDVEVPKDMGLPVKFGRLRSGPGKKLTSNQNTWVSCIAVLRECWRNPWEESQGPEYVLAVYHNPFAKHPLDPAHLVGDRVRHFRMKEDQSNWKPCPQ